MGRYHETPSCGLIDLRCYIAYRPNSTTAWSKTSTGRPISVSCCAARPPALSQVSVHCPGLELDEKALPAWVISSDADLVVLRVPLDPVGRVNQTCCDYFVYRTHPQHTKLDLLPNPRPTRLGDDDIAVLSRGGGRYVVAGLRILPGRGREHTFDLHLYRSTDDGDPPPGAGRWTSQRVSVEEPLRDRVCPIPDKAEIEGYHSTNEVIVLGGDKGLVGWVDLWRGILLCDVLSEIPTLRDIPLPAPAKGNWTKFVNYCPHFFRSIAVSQRRDTIRYVKMEITLPMKVPITSSSSRPEPTSFYEWVHSQRRDQEQPKSYTWVPGSWTATTYSMPIPVASWDGWRRDCSLRLADLKLPARNDDPRQCKLLNRLMSRMKEQQEVATKATLSMGYVSMAYPALSTDDGDVVYLLSKGHTGMEAVVLKSNDAHMSARSAYWQLCDWLLFPCMQYLSGLSGTHQNKETKKCMQTWGRRISREEAGRPDKMNGRLYEQDFRSERWSLSMRGRVPCEDWRSFMLKGTSDYGAASLPRGSLNISRLQVAELFCFLLL